MPPHCRRDVTPRGRHTLDMAKDAPAPLQPHKAISTTTAVGARAEDRAAEFLVAHGLFIIARNLRCKAGELDLICLDGEVLVIIEVRLRSRADFGGASASVTAHKRRKLIRATRYFWQREPAWRTRIMRFDVVAMQIAPPDAAPKIDWIKDAFRTR